MLLKQMLVAPTTTSDMVVFDAFKPFDRDTLVREVIGLANAEVEGPRYILFGVNPGGVDGKKIVGISDDTVTQIKRAQRLVSSLVEPSLDLAFIFDKVDSKLVGALEIDGCDFGPYFVAHDLGGELSRGACWRRQGRELVALERNEMQNGHANAVAEEAPVVIPHDVLLSVGFDDDPDCEYIEVDVPDSSEPPFAEEYSDDSDDNETKSSRTLAESLKNTVSMMTTQMLKLGKASDEDDAGKQIAEAARNHYFYEECAVKVDLCIRNDSDVDIDELAVEFGVPLVDGFEVVDRIYTSPFDKRAAGASSKTAYPEVEVREDAAYIRTTVKKLAANGTKQLFGNKLRLAVGPDALGRKLAMQYVLRTADGRKIGDGRVKIRLGTKPRKSEEPAEKTLHADMANA